MTLLEAMDHPELFKPWFKNPKDWIAWRTFIAALFGLPLSKDQRAIFKTCTGRAKSPAKQVEEAWLICGRRGGKSFSMALIAVFIACFSDFRKFLTPGERATIMVVSANRKQAKNTLRYIQGLLTGVPLLKKMVERETADTFDLTNSATIEVMVASSKSIRGYTVAAAICDEIAHWETSEDAADPDVSVLDALRPAMATIDNAMLLCASSPYAKKGALWQAFDEHYGEESDVLVWKADTRTMNPTITEAFVAKQYRKDKAWADAEYGANFRNDIAAFVDPAVVERCLHKDGLKQVPAKMGNYYWAFFNAAGGSGGDSATGAVCHQDARTRSIMIDAVFEAAPPFSPEQAISDCVTFFKPYGIRNIHLDRWGGDFPSEQFRKWGINCTPCEKPKSDLYKEFLPLLNSEQVILINHPKMLQQLCALERRTARGGRDL